MAGNERTDVMTDQEIEYAQRRAAMNIAANLPAEKEAALKVLSEAQRLVEWAHRPSPQLRDEP